MAMSKKKKKWLTDEEIQELIFLPDGELSDANFDSDPDDPDYDPRDARKLIDTFPLEIVTNLRDKEPCVEDDGGMSSDNVEALPVTFSCPLGGSAQEKERKRSQNMEERRPFG